MPASRYFHKMISAAAMAVCALVAANADAAPKYIAKIGHLEAATQPRHRTLEQVAAVVKEKTNGDVEFQLFPSSQLGNARQMIEGTQFGSLESTVMPAAFLGGFNPVVSVFDIPFVLPEDSAKANALRTGPFGKYVLDSFSSRGMTAIMLWPNGRKNMTSNKPLAAMADFKGQKFRVMDSKILIEQFSAVGASAIALPFGELYTALQTGVVDGEENPLDTIATMKFHEVQKYLVVSQHGAMEDVALFNTAWWNSLPEEYRTIIVEAFKDGQSTIEKLKAEAHTQALEKIKAAGVEVRELGATERTEWRAAMAPTSEAAFVARTGDEGKKALEIYHAEMKKLGLE